MIIIDIDLTERIVALEAQNSTLRQHIEDLREDVYKCADYFHSDHLGDLADCDDDQCIEAGHLLNETEVK